MTRSVQHDKQSNTDHHYPLTHRTNTFVPRYCLLLFKYTLSSLSDFKFATHTQTHTHTVHTQTHTTHRHTQTYTWHIPRLPHTSLSIVFHQNYGNISSNITQKCNCLKHWFVESLKNQLEYKHYIYILLKSNSCNNRNKNHNQFINVLTPVHKAFY